MIDLTNKTKDELLSLVESTEQLKKQFQTRYLDFIFPDTGTYSRDKYGKALEFFRAGKDHHFRMLSGSNGSGKSFSIATEAVYHWTGEYPEWWEGKVQDAPKHWWIIAESGGTFKSSMQRLLMGDTLDDETVGSGLIPKERIVKWAAMPGISGAVGTIWIRHKKGHIVTVEVKASEQKRENLQAANLDGVLFDEEPPIDVYTECVFRLRSTSKKPLGISLLGFTPLKGLSDVVLAYLKNGQYPEFGEHPDDREKYVVRIEMTDVPHLTDEDRRMYIMNCPPNELEARTRGIPALGAGKIYPIPESQVFVDPFKIPNYWPRCFSLDFGWHCTCVLWGAKDPHTNTLYIYAEYYQGQQSAQIHALNILAKGNWIPGVCDPSGGGRSADGELMVDTYRKHGLDIVPADNAKLAGITRVLDLLQSGKLKIFNNLENTKKEYRLYRYDTKNPNEPAPNQDDHAMDNLKYITSRFDWVAITQEQFENRYKKDIDSPRKKYHRDNTTGY